jgi:hypothetical protein
VVVPRALGFDAEPARPFASCKWRPVDIRTDTAYEGRSTFGFVRRAERRRE